LWVGSADLAHDACLLPRLDEADWEDDLDLVEDSGRLDPARLALR
jgi:hypothetical protein